MTRNVIVLLAIIGLLLVIVSCSDSARKTLLGDSQMRVEYADCIGCNECIEDFDCPEDAFTKDERTQTVYIDVDKCTNCMKCVQEFQCPEQAITQVRDLIAPAEIKDLKVVSSEIGELQIRFTAVGDDSLTGLAYGYNFAITDKDGSSLDYDFETPLPSMPGTQEEWNVSGLPEYESVIVSLEVYDEMQQKPALALAAAVIEGEFIDNIPPAAITDLTATSGEEEIKLNWTATGDDYHEGSAVSYQIKYSDNEIDNSNWDLAETWDNEIVPAASGTSEEYTITELTIGTEYYFAIRALDNEDQSSNVSNSVSAIITGDATAPAGINDAEFITPALNSMVLKWTAVGDNGNEGTAVSYLIKYNLEEITEANWETSTVFVNEITPAEAGSIEQIQIDGLESETQYYAAIIAIDDADNNSPLSNIAVGATEAMPDETAPAAITDLAATTTETEVILNWTATGDDENEGTAFQYILKRSNSEINDTNWDTAETITGVSAPQIAGSAESFTFNDCELNVTYYFAIKVIDDSNNSSAQSNLVEATLVLAEDSIAPAAIALEVVDEQVYNLTTIKVRWDAPGDDGNVGTATSYELRYATAPINDSNWTSATLVNDLPAPEAAGTQQTHIVTDLQEATIYYFAMKATDENSNTSDISNCPAGKIVYQILTSQCRDCNRCINECPEDAIYDAGSYKAIDEDDCVACGECVSECPWNLIRKWVVAY